MRISAGEKKRQSILEAALNVIALEGVDAVTHRRVAKEADVSHGVVSYHFATRDSLVHKSFEFYFGSFEDLMTKGGWKPNKKMSKRQILDLLTTIIKNELSDLKGTLIEQELILIAARNSKLAKLYREWEKSGIDIFAADLKRSGYKQPKDVAHILINLIRGFLLERLTDNTLTEKHFRKRANVLLSAISSEMQE